MSLAILNNAASRKLSQNTLPIALTRLGFLPRVFCCGKISTFSGLFDFIITSSKIGFSGEERSGRLEKNVKQ